MSFISPIFLLGLLGITLPILIHLAGRRRAQVYRFSALEFILRSQKRMEARLKLEQLLLLLLRIGVISLLALALAKPVIRTAGLPLPAPGAPSSNVLIMDNSYSMGYLDDKTPLLERAKEWARQLVGSLSPSDEVCLLTLFPGQSASGGLPELTIDKGDALSALEKLETSFYTTDISLLLEQALTVLGSSKKGVQRVFLFTDLTKNGWNPPQADASGRLEGMKARLKDRPVRFHIIDVSQGKALANLSISSLECHYDWTKKDGQVILKTSVSNFSEASVKNLLIKANLGEKTVAQGFLDLEPRTTGQKEFLLEPPGEALPWGSVEIPADSLPADSHRYFTLPTAKDIKVLVIDGSPSINIYQSESFYLERALNPARLHTSHIRPLVLNPQEITSVELKDFDLLILSNVEELHYTKVSELQRYVAEGGKVLFTLGDNVRPEYYNTALAGLVPRLRNVVEFPKEEALGLAPLDTTHPMLNIFAQERRSVLRTPQFHKVFMIEPEMGGKTTAIISYSNGAPALIEMPYGQGRSMVLTSTIDRDWTDLPVKPLFLPLIQQICRYLTGNLVEVVNLDILVGEPWEMPLYEEKETVEALDPKGNLLKPEIKGEEPTKTLVFPQTHYPGIYKLRRPTQSSSGGAGLSQTGGEPLTAWASFAVNVDPREGDLTKIDKTLLKDLLGEERVSFSLTSPVEGAGGVTEGKRLWSSLLFAALCLLAMEACVSWRRPL